MGMTIPCHPKHHPPENLRRHRTKLAHYSNKCCCAPLSRRQAHRPRSGAKPPAPVSSTSSSISFATGRREPRRSEVPDDVGGKHGERMRPGVVERLDVERIIPADLRAEGDARREPVLPADGEVQVFGLKACALAVE